MASMNYCFTVCRAAEEHHPKPSSSVDISSSTSPGAGAYFFGRFFSFGLTPSASTSQLTNPFTVKASTFTDIDEDLF